MDATRDRDVLTAAQVRELYASLLATYRTHVKGFRNLPNLRDDLANSNDLAETLFACKAHFDMFIRAVVESRYRRWVHLTGTGASPNGQGQSHPMLDLPVGGDSFAVPSDLLAESYWNSLFELHRPESVVEQV